MIEVTIALEKNLLKKNSTQAMEKCPYSHRIVDTFFFLNWFNFE